MKNSALEQREQVLINNFIKRFMLNSQSNASNGDQINLKMAMKALPFFIDRNNIYKVDLINFQKVQQALIWFVNDDQDEMFNYYDNRNIKRLDEVNNTNRLNDDIILKITRNSSYLNSYFLWKDHNKER